MWEEWHWQEIKTRVKVTLLLFYMSKSVSPPCPPHPTLPCWQDTGATSYFTLLESFYVVRGIATLVFFDLVLLLLGIY